MNFFETKKFFPHFQAYCKKWIEKLGLTGWRIYVTQTENEYDHLATNDIDAAAKSCIINLSTLWQEYENESVEDEMEFAAFHEVMHTMLADVVHLSKTRPMDVELIEMAEHAVIAKIWTAITKKDCVIVPGASKKKTRIPK